MREKIKAVPSPVGLGKNQAVPSLAGPAKKQGGTAGLAGRPGWAGLCSGKGENAVLEASGRPAGRRLPKEIHDAGLARPGW